jgi:RHS repeat-associated protein
LPSGRIITYRYDSLKRLQSIEATLNGQPQTIVDAITYQADGRITGRRFGNGLVDTRSYDLQGRLQLRSLDVQTAYDYDANGNLLQRTGHNYRYDALDRLTGELDANQQQDYGYDPNGNRETLQNAQNTLAYSYAADSNRLSTIGQTELTYDAAGHLTQDVYGRSLTYNQAGRLTTITDNAIELARYTYNANGQRVIKITAAGTTIYHYDPSGRLISETTEGGTPIRDYLWHGLTPIAQIEIGATTETILYLHTDHLATPRNATNAAGHTVWRWNSDAFGAAPADEDPDGNGSPTQINLRFPGQYFDRETGLHYNWMRYYDPQTGRYISSDPIGLDGGLNTYGYAAGNPLAFADPAGLCPICYVAYAVGRQAIFYVGRIATRFLATRFGQALTASVPLIELANLAQEDSPAGICKNPVKMDRILDTRSGIQSLTHQNGIYEVIYEQAISGATRSVHRTTANRALLKAVESDPQFARQLGDILGVDDVAVYMRNGRSALRNPPATEWHHPIDNPKVMRLLRRQVHRHPELQNILHSGPKRTGGFSQHFGGSN